MRIHLTDGRPEGLLNITVPRWDLDGHVCSRKRYPSAKTLDFFRRPGVYILEGETDPPSALPRLYIGKADTLVDRVSRWYNDLDFWQRVVTLSTSGAPPTQTLVSYLESSLIRRGKEAKRAVILNKTAPKFPPASQADLEDARTFFDQVLVVLPVVGIRAFELPERKSSGGILESHTPELFYDQRGSKAEGYVTDGGFMLKKGATGRAEHLPAAPLWLRNLRASLVEAGVLEEDSSLIKLTQDYEFGSSSTAAAVLVGGTVPGPIQWKTKDGRTLKRLEEDALRP